MESRPSDRHFLRDANIVAVASALRRFQPISRVELADRTGLGRSTITTIINTLLENGLVRETGEAESAGGRRPILLELVERARLVTVMRLTPQTVTLGLADLYGRIVYRQRRGLRVPTHRSGEVLEHLSVWVEEMLKEAGAAEKVLGLGIALPGTVADGSSRVSSPELGWDGVEVVPWLSDRLGMPVLVENETNAFTLGESLLGAAAGRRDVIGATLGASVATGLLLNGEIYRGPGGAFGGIGHVLVEPDGPLCTCGAKGCLQALAADGALVAAARAALQAGAASLIAELVEGRLGALTRGVIVAAAQDGDRLALDLLAQSGSRVGSVLGILTAALNPAAVVIGGEAVEQAGALLFEPLADALRQRLPDWLSNRVELLPATLGENAWLIGAAGLMLELVFAPPAGSAEVSLASWRSRTQGGRA